MKTSGCYETSTGTSELSTEMGKDENQPKLVGERKALAQELFYKWLVASHLASFKICTLQLTQQRKGAGRPCGDSFSIKGKEGAASRVSESFPKNAWTDNCLSACLGVLDMVGHVSTVQH